MDMLEPALLIEKIGMIVFLIGISLAGLSGKTQAIDCCLSQPLNRSIIGQLKAYLRRYDISFLLFFIGGIIIVAAAAMVVITVFQTFLT